MVNFILVDNWQMVNFILVDNWQMANVLGDNWQSSTPISKPCHTSVPVTSSFRYIHCIEYRKKDFWLYKLQFYSLDGTSYIDSQWFLLHPVGSCTTEWQAGYMPLVLFYENYIKERSCSVYYLNTTRLPHDMSYTMQQALHDYLTTCRILCSKHHTTTSRHVVYYAASTTRHVVYSVQQALRHVLWRIEQPKLCSKHYKTTWSRKHYIHGQLVRVVVNCGPVV
jgi:hypothetical protein